MKTVTTRTSSSPASTLQHESTASSRWGETTTITARRYLEESPCRQMEPKPRLLRLASPFMHGRDVAELQRLQRLGVMGFAISTAVAEG